MTKETLRRAHTVAHSDPMGPVYLMLPRETLTQTWDEAAMRPFPAERYGAVRSGAADAEAVARLADKLLAAKHPVMVTCYAGRNQQAPALIEELATFAGIRVYEAGPLYLNISRASPCFAGMMPAIAEADVGLLVDVDVPWIPKHTKENPNTWWAHIDVDVVKECFPIWGFASNARLQGDSFLILRQLLEVLKAKGTPAFREAAAKRVEAMKRESSERLASIAKQASDKGKPGAINPHYLCAEVSKALGEDSIVINEGIRNGPIVNNQIMRTRPGSSIGFAGGGLGSSSGTALGIKLARSGATVVQMVGDGGFYFGNPSSVYAVSKQYKLPIFTVLFDNSGWSAVKEATLRVYPEGEAKASNEFNALLAPEIEFTKICEAAGGYGEKVTEPDAVPAAIQRCLKEVRGGRSALMHVRIPVL
jgi:acetolactate synthase-1/2/3 large subunit